MLGGIVDDGVAAVKGQGAGGAPDGFMDRERHLARVVIPGDTPDACAQFFECEGVGQNEVERFRVDTERRHNAVGELVSVSEAIVKVSVDGETLISAAEGNGPVNALDLALRKDLGKYQRYIDDLELLDYRVRVFQGGTDAVTRVLIEFGDQQGERWSTVGVSANIIDASFQALLDAINYKLMKAGA